MENKTQIIYKIHGKFKRFKSLLHLALKNLCINTLVFKYIYIYIYNAVDILKEMHINLATFSRNISMFTLENIKLNQ